jgi:hypothetical protein
VVQIGSALGPLGRESHLPSPVLSSWLIPQQPPNKHLVHESTKVICLQPLCNQDLEGSANSVSADRRFQT